MTISAQQLDSALADLRAQVAAGRALPGVRAMQVHLDTSKASAPAWIRVTEELLKLGQAPAATVIAQSGLQRFPSATSLHYLLGNALRIGGHAADAEVQLRRVLSVEPTHADAAASLAHLLREQGRLQAAATVVHALWQNAPRSRANDLRTVLFLRECQQHALVEPMLETILAAHPDNAELLSLAGETALVLGRFGDAQRRTRAALDRDPTQAAAWLRLAHTHRFSQHDDPDLERLDAALEDGRLDETSRICVEFARGKALDDLGDHAGAAQAWMRANTQRRRQRPWDRDGWQRYVDAQCRVPPLRPIATMLTDIPVFIVGLPRSGTTLASSLLGRHAQVRNRSELNWIAAFAARLGPSPNADALAQAARLYHAQLRQDDTPALCYVDKNPLNFRHLGLIAAMFPQARILHCRRDLRDTALSLWSQHFAHDDMAWSYDLGDIADYVRGYRRLMAHWRDARGIAMLEFDYEAMVGDTGATLAAIQAFLGLDAAGAAPQPERTDAIATASVWQARQQVYASSIGRWRAYAELLPDLMLL